jgi:Predicted AAA-ATPase/PD-(D/E)XK nuclease superfamily
MQTLPIGVQDFVQLRERSHIYVDKTQQIFDLMQVGAFVFLSRPRRFGKSLLTTTLKAIFEGKRELFQGLWIEDKIDWQPRPVILINFNALNYREKSLAQALTEHMDELATEAGISLSSDDYKTKFRELITRLAERGKIALLIDEYDKAITDLLENQEKVTEHVATLKNFYSVLKSIEAEHLHFTLLTGVSKYGKLSIFSDLNNLLDVTLDTRFATLLGYTQTELEHYFGAYIDQIALRYVSSRAEVIEQIKFWYNGYSWDGIHRVYVPFSTLVFFSQQTFANHWFATATPSFLIKLLRQQQLPAYTLDDITADSTLLDSADLNQISVISLLFQTGYLTVKQVERSFQGDTYTLGYPNYEVAQAFQQHLLTDYLTANIDQISVTLLANLRKALQTQNVDTFIATLKSVFDSIPHTLFLPQEAYYHSVVYLVLRLLGFTVEAERLNNLGRLDAVLELHDVVYILEFKMSEPQPKSRKRSTAKSPAPKPTPAQIAIAQIRTKQYDLPFRNRGKIILLVGIAFDQQSHNISEWQVEQA